jgi:hypothetical protein
VKASGGLGTAESGVNLGRGPYVTAGSELGTEFTGSVAVGLRFRVTDPLPETPQLQMAVSLGNRAAIQVNMGKTRDGVALTEVALEFGVSARPQGRTSVGVSIPAVPSPCAGPGCSRAP